MRPLVLGLLGTTLTFAFLQACGPDPSGDPRTPANSPIPKIDRPADPVGTPTSPSSPSVTDGG